MRCRHCGTEIADKAIVCYRCGEATSEPAHKAPSPRRATPSVGLLAATLALVLLAVAAFYAGSDSVSQPLRWVVIAGALALIVIRVVMRRSRR